MLSFSHNVEFVFFFFSVNVLPTFWQHQDPQRQKTAYHTITTNSNIEQLKTRQYFSQYFFKKQFNLLRYHIQKTNFTGTNFGSPSLFTSEIKRVSFAFSELVSCTTLILVGAEFKRSVENCLNKILLFACQSCNFYTSKSYISLAIYLSKRQ